MKKILPIFLAFLVLLSLPVHAADGKLSATAAGTGDQVTLTVQLQNPGIIAMRIFIQYDANVLQLTEAKNGVVFPSGTFGNDLSADPYTMLWDESLRHDNNTTSGTLCTLTFTIVGGTKTGQTNVAFTIDQSSTFDVTLHGAAIAECACTVSVPVDDTQPTAGTVQSVTANDLELIYKAVGLIEPAVTTDGETQCTVAYSGFDGKIISVDADGKVTAKKAGTTTVTVTAEDEDGNTAECFCTVTVRYAWWQILIRVFLLGFLWY